jgi:sugar-specific transcriptional regulator TrmB
MEITEFLDKLQLSQYEKQAYLSLLRLGRVKSRQVANESGVSYGRIYEILDKLEKKGLISILPTKPKSFEAIDPSIALRLAIHREIDLLHETEKQLKSLKIPAHKPAAQAAEKTLILHGFQKQMEMITDMSLRAQKEILIIPGVWDPTTKTSTHQSTIHHALERGVSSRMLLRAVTPNNRALAKERLRRGQKIRQRELSGLRLHIIDRKEALISIVDDKKTKERISIYTSNKEFANSMAIFFDSLWEKSKPINLK